MPWQYGTVAIPRASALVAYAVVAAATGYGASLFSGPTANKVVNVAESIAPLSGPLSLVATYGPQPGAGTVQLVRLVGSHEFAVGSPLVSFQWNTGTHPLVTTTPSFLWLFELGSSTPPTVWRISNSSGAVLQKTTVPPLIRPVLAADASGLYLGGGGSFGGVGHVLIFHVGVGVSSVDTVLGTGSTPASDEFVASLATGNGKVVATVCTRPLGRPCPTRVIAERS
jgi:hypothetical protein